MLCVGSAAAIAEYQNLSSGIDTVCQYIRALLDFVNVFFNASTFGLDAVSKNSQNYFFHT